MTRLATLVLIFFLSCGAAAQYTIGPSTPIVPPPPPPSGGVTDENYYDNVDGTCRNMPVTDGPAHLPEECFNTAMENTPAGPAFYCVVPSNQTPPPSCNGSLYNYATVTGAFNAVNSGVIPCGSIVKIVATSDGTPHGQQNTYIENNLKYPGRVCDQGHWIWIESDMLAQLPPEGSRISPAWIGVPSLPGRPSYAQPAVAGIYMPKIVAGSWNSVTLGFTSNTSATGAVSSYVRFIGIEFVQPVTGAAVCVGRNCQNGWQNSIVDTNCMGTGVAARCPDHIIFDRVIVTPDVHTGRSTITVCTGMRLTATSSALVNSYVFQIAGQMGYCEPKALGAGNTDSTTQGPYKYFNNFLEGGGENYFFGGGVTKSQAVNVQFRRCHMFSPWTLWMPFRATEYIGLPILKKNLGESKAIRKVLFEGNIYEYTWYGGDQNGTTVSDQFATAVLLHAASGNITGTFQDLAEDMTFRYNVVRHGARGAGLDNSGCDSSFQAGCSTLPPGRVPPILQRLTAHDNVWDDISGKWFTSSYNGGGNGFDGNGLALTNPLQNVGRNTPINNIYMDHNTIINTSYSQDLTVASIVVGPTGVATLTATGQIPLLGTGQGPSMNSSRKIQVFASCPGFNQYATMSTYISGNPVSFTYPGAPANQTCNHGFVSLIHGRAGASLSFNEGTYDRKIVSAWQTGDVAFALVTGINWTQSYCIAVGIPAGCPSAMPFTVWGFTGANVCYNNLQAGCGAGGNETTPATWTLVSRAYCNGVGTGTFPAGGVDPDLSKCQASGQGIMGWHHVQTGLNTVNPGNAFFSYWPYFGAYNYGPSPNLAWKGIVFTNNISGGRGAKMSAGYTTACTVAVSDKTQSMLDVCGVVAPQGTDGAYVYRCNVVASWPMISSVANPTDTLPPDNSDTPDKTFQSVGFTNFNYDGLGLGVPDMSDLVLAPTSPFKGGLPGCDGKDPGADISLVKLYTAGVE